MTHSRVPKLRVPLQLNGSHVDTVEQDESEEIEQCVLALLRTPLESRNDDEEIGLPDYTFMEGGADIEQILEMVETFEPRVRLLAEGRFEGLVDTVRIDLANETEEFPNYDD